MRKKETFGLPKQVCSFRNENILSLKKKIIKLLTGLIHMYVCVYMCICTYICLLVLFFNREIGVAFW